MRANSKIHTHLLNLLGKHRYENSVSLLKEQIERKGKQEIPSFFKNHIIVH